MTNPVHNEFYREYDLSEKRRTPPRRSPAAHQQTALAKLHAWSESRASHSPVSGGLLVLPTGGGKTFTANRFLCAGPLSQGFKVLWLAHTHHLLEQAIDSLEHELGHIQEPKATFAARVVSGTVSHCRPHEIKPSDDMLIVTLQTMVSALRNELPPVLDFLAAAGSQLCVVFDEAHHAPAHSYRRLIAVLRERCPGMLLLGLTATPTYTDETKRGWLAMLFPQGLIHQVTAQALMATGILAKPIFEDHQTDIAVEFDERSYEQWRSTYQDLPESMVTQLAQSRERNQFIAQTYAEHRERYGKTIMFADRWFQCEQLSEFLQARGVRAGVLYSHVDADPGNVAARNRRSSDENTTVLQAFKRGALDVLINVRMLTEGTAVPSVSTVFLTRQSTSGILLTQMIGRALRGPAFGGTEQAYIVAFIDQWKHLINWADYRDIGAGLADDTAASAAPRLPIQLISIEMVRQLVQQMDGGSVETRPFLTLMPVGWYRVEFTAVVAGSDDLEIVRQMVMVFEDEIAGYDAWRAALTPTVYADFAATELDFTAERGQLAEWRQEFFGAAALNRGEDLLVNLFHMARHLAQNEGTVTFFPFAEREYHDLDRVVTHFLDENITMRDELPAVRAEYDRTDRYWGMIYPGFPSVLV